MIAPQGVGEYMRARLALARAEALGLRGPRVTRSQRRLPRLAWPDLGMGIRALEAATGIAHDTLKLWRERGLTFDNADRLALALGMRPEEIWSEWLYLDDPLAIADPWAPEHQIIEAPGGARKRAA